MIKKIAVISTLAVVLALGVFGTVNTTHAQQVEAEEAPAAQVMTQEEAAFEYQYAYQYGNENGDPVSTMTQTRTQTRELQDGECDGEPIQRQLRQQLHVNQNEMREQNEMRQLRQDLRDGTCNGKCLLLGQGGQGE